MGEQLAITGLNKTFGPARVLRDVSFAVKPGEIHALVGQNGSGKSTLVKILSGVHPADEAGAVIVDGVRLSNPVKPAELRDHGLAFVHQDLGLVDQCTVLDNIRLGSYQPRQISRRIDWRRERVAAVETLRRLHSTIDTGRLVNGLDAGDKAVVAVARALQGLVPGAGYVVFDESTRALPRELLPDFYAIVRRLAESGTGIIAVSHSLEEVLTLAHRVTVLQDGRVVIAGRSTHDLTEHSLARLLLGREVELLEDRTAEGEHHVSTVPVRLRARGLRSNSLRSLDLDVHEGEVVGITGATGSGHAELPAVLAGAAPGATGTVEVDERTFALSRTGPDKLIDAGLALVPADRAHEGLALSMTAQENLSLPRTRRRGRILLSSAWQRREFDEAAGLLGIVPVAPDQICSSFSGGNQQKLLIAKWLFNGPRMLLLHEPTQAVDVGARIDILRVLRAAADDGVSIVISSTEPNDLAAICDRVVVLRDGAVAAELTADVTPDAVATATYPIPADAGQ